MTDNANDKKKSKLPLIIVAVVAILALAGGGAWFYLQSQKAHTAEVAKTKDIPAAAMVKKPVFLPVPKFVLSVDGQDSLHYLMLELTLMSYNPDQIKAMEPMMPIIRNAIITLLSEKTYKELTAPNVIPPLEKQICERLRTVLNNTIGSAGVDKVLITKLVLQ
ncbi:flagellar basal body-associated FliL family protein [Parasalinivibrio latis]|uniref:flagellar basal body-associated FliL family protein n=1 Tax=Parasalinivibrio latis TaxID=2952610 RepID=UPI0030E052F4